MWIVILVIFLASVNFQVLSATISVEIKCTENCVCDHFRGLRRASCINGKMANLKDNVPRKTQILQFSYNYLTKIHNDEFLKNELEDLRILNLSNNRISEIEIFAFEFINNLEIIDLSHNALQYILPEWFWSLDSLHELHLNGNSLGAFKYRALFDSPTLQVFNLADCQLPHLFQSTLSQLPALQVLDVSGNHLIDFKVSVIEHLPELVELKLQRNNINCKNLNELFKYLDSKAIIHQSDCQSEADFVEVEEFAKGKVNRKFEKLIEKSESNEEKKIETSWILEEKETISDILEANGYKCPTTDKGFLLGIIEWSPSISLSLTLLFGLMLGVIIGYSCSFCLRKPRQRNIKPIRRVRRSFSIIRNGNIQDRQYLIRPQFSQ